MARAHSKVRKGEETAGTLVDIGMRLFSTHGFHGVSAEQIVESAGLSRGALYHHFGGKLGLFEAVFVECEREIASRIEAAARRKQVSVDQLVAGSIAFLDACADSALRRIVIDDAPGVLGWSKWREIDAAHGLALLRGAVERLRHEGKIEPYSVDALTYLLSGAMNELAMWVAESTAPQTDLRAAKRSIEATILAIAR